MRLAGKLRSGLERMDKKMPDDQVVLIAQSLRCIQHVPCGRVEEVPQDDVDLFQDVRLVDQDIADKPRKFPGKTTLTWNPETSVGSYNVYRGDCATLSSSYGSKVQSGISGATTTDGEEPVAGQCFFYLITASNRLDEEGTKGTDSFGNPRP